MRNMPIGIDDFELANNQYYVDKTLIIKDIIDSCIGKSLLITKPRRFGKSLTLSMIDYFFTNKGDYKYLFDDKLILKNDKYLSYINQNPVIHLNMKNLSSSNYNTLIEQTIDLISNEFRKFIELKDSDKLINIERKEFIEIVDKKINNPLMYIDSIKVLAKLLYIDYGKKAVILIDEYDTPLEGAFQKGFYDKAIEFYKKFYSSALKTNEYLLFSITTGVLEIAKESIFSDLNNLNVFSVLDDDLIEYFGFTENEVIKMLKDFNINVAIEEVKKWYGGYGNNKIDIYNPWSILNFISKEKFLPYWVNTGSNNTIISLIQNIPNSIENLNEYINNKNKILKINNSISYKDVKEDFDTLISYLTQTGYLTALSCDLYGNYFVKIPNKEIEDVFEKEIIARGLNKEHFDLAKEFRDSLLNADNNKTSEILKKYVLESYSYYDLKVEKDYQNMLTGILAVLFSDYVVKSEIDNKRGRCDIMISPKMKNDFGIIIEVKKYKNNLAEKRISEYCINALKQIKEKEYHNKLIARNTKKIILYSIVFDDKKNMIESEIINSK